VEGGSEDRVTTHAVVIASGGPTTPNVRCSGTLISPNVVLTVRHCLSRLESPQLTCDRKLGEPAGVPSDLWVNATPWSLPGTTWKNVASWIVPTPSEICGNDVALLVLATAFEASEAEPARPVVREAELRMALSSRLLGIAGFGASSPAASDSGRRRSRFDVPIQCVPGDLSFACGRELDYTDVREFTGGAGPCMGDSGAGALLATDHGVVFGVLSRGNVASGHCSEGVFERTDVWGWLIAKTVLDAAPPGASPVAWARSLFPEPPRTGDFCRGAGSCASDATCVSFDGERSFTCADRCDGARACADGFHCDGNACAPGSVSTASAGGCSVLQRERASHGSSVLLCCATALAVVLVARRRRRPQ
jgi:Trypsin